MARFSFFLYGFTFASSTSSLQIMTKLSEGRPESVRNMRETLASPKLPADIVKHAIEMNARAKSSMSFTDDELDGVIHSLQNLTPVAASDSISWDQLRTLLGDVSHLSHKNWDVTGKNAELLGDVLLKNGLPVQLLERILKEGNWKGAQEHSEQKANYEPWAVLVTGVNGIRKTTSIYQEWFPSLLAEALVAPEGSKAEKVDRSLLPVGSNSFFRQLDHMICTVCNDEFTILYYLVSKLLDDERKPNKDIVQKYSDLKAGIFTRYRTLSELLGVVLLREAQKIKSNCMLETSGRDVAMFTYIDNFFPDKYRKLALHFRVNDLSQAETSVDSRMMNEIDSGRKAVKSGSVWDVVYANQGGPYGSEVLKGIQKDSDSVWESVVDGTAGVGKDWYTATIQINAKENKPWTAQAVKPDGSLGTEFTFERK